MAGDPTFIQKVLPTIVGVVLGQIIAFIVAWNFFRWRIRHEDRTKSEERKRTKANVFFLIWEELNMNLIRLESINRTDPESNTPINESLKVNNKNAVWSIAITFSTESKFVLSQISGLYDRFEFLNRHLDRRMFWDPNHAFPYKFLRSSIDDCRRLADFIKPKTLYQRPIEKWHKVWINLNGFDAPMWWKKWNLKWLRTWL